MEDKLAKFRNKLQCKRCDALFNTKEELTQHKIKQHGQIPRVKQTKPKVKEQRESRSIPIENLISFPTYRYRYGDDEEPTKIIDPSKVTKRLIYGDKEFSTPEKDACGHRAYNGKEIDGAIHKLESGWLNNKVENWKDSKNQREQMLYREYLNPDTHKVNYSCNQQWLIHCFPFIKENGYNLSKAILMELLLECYNEKFGVCINVVKNEEVLGDTQHEMPKMFRRSI